MASVPNVVSFPSTDRRAVMIPANLYEMLKELADQLGEPMNDYTVEILQAHMRWIRQGALRRD